MDRQPLAEFSADSLVGVRRDLAVAKRDLILLDKVVILGLARQLEVAYDRDPALAANALFLVERGVYVEGPDVLAEFALGVAESARRGNAVTVPFFGIGTSIGNTLSPKIREALPFADGALGLSNPEMMQVLGMGYGPDSASTSELLKRLLCFDGAIPSLYEDRPSALEAYTTHGVLDEKNSREGLIEIVISSLPIPGPDVPLDDILDFARDPATAAARRRLLRAVTRSDLERVGPDLFRLNLEEAIESYREHVAIAALTRQSASMSILLSVAGAVEELLHVRPKKALETLVDFRRVKAERLRAELTAPGREAALIYEAEQRYGS